VDFMLSKVSALMLKINNNNYYYYSLGFVFCICLLSRLFICSAYVKYQCYN